MTNKTEKEFLDAYDAYAESVLKHIYFRINNWELAEDMTQETFLKTWDYIAGNKGKINNFKTFIYRIAHNLIVDHYRRKPRIPISLETIPDNKAAMEPVQEKQTDGILQKELVEKYLAELDDDRRKILAYRYIDDLSIREISEITSRSENNVSVAIHRAIKILKEKIWKKKQK
jgi:RNA polymerase sigma-70 factor, ECF subfamily